MSTRENTRLIARAPLIPSRIKFLSILAGSSCGFYIRVRNRLMHQTRYLSCGTGSSKGC